jgi:hypothetical protein
LTFDQNLQVIAIFSNTLENSLKLQKLTTQLISSKISFKKKMKRQNRIRIALAVTGVVLLAFGLILGYVIFPVVVQKLVRDELNIWDPESEGSMNFVIFFLLLLSS